MSLPSKSRQLSHFTGAGVGVGMAVRLFVGRGVGRGVEGLLREGAGVGGGVVAMGLMHVSLQ